MATLGVTTIGSVTQSTNNALIMSKATAGESFTAVGMYVYIDPNSPSSTALSVSIFSDNAGVPNALLGQGDIASYSPVTAGWKAILFDSSISITNGSVYWLGLWYTDSENRYKNTGSGNRYQKIVFSGFPDWSNYDPWTSGTSSTGAISIYATDVVEVTVTDNRSARIKGKVTTTDNRTSKLRGGYVYTFQDDFSTTDNKDAANSSLVEWTGDGEIRLQG